MQKSERIPIAQYKEQQLQKERDANLNLSKAVFGSLPPQVPEIESVVLGACLIDTNAFAKIADILQPIHFYKEESRVIFEAMTALSIRLHPIDRLTVFEQIAKDGGDKVNPYYLVQLTELVASSAHVESHARLIAQKYLLREVINISTDAIQKAYSGNHGGLDSLDLVDSVQQKLFNLSQVNAKKQVADTSKLSASLTVRLQKMRDFKGKLTGVTSGMQSLDKLTGGFQKSDLIVIAARPAMGKTALVSSIILNAAKTTGVLLFSLEMPQDQITSRMWANLGSHDLNGLTKDSNLFDENEWNRVFDETAMQFEGLPIFVDDSSNLTILEIASKSREKVKNCNVGLIVIDYLQLIHGIGRHGNREQEIASISRGLKALAKDLDVPIIALAQLSRAVETRGGSKRPQLSDLRESGAIEMDADLVGFIYRPEAYDILEDENGQSTKGVADIIVAKHRNGSIGDVRLKFSGKYQRFWDEGSTSFDDFNDCLRTPIISQDNIIIVERLISDDIAPW
jgi:replicative DNA helicase